MVPPGLTEAGKFPDMDRSDVLTLSEEAETCRRKALAYLGCPEAPFLLSIAKAFDDMAYGRLTTKRTAVPDDPRSDGRPSSIKATRKHIIRTSA